MPADSAASRPHRAVLIGLISDTHGLLRPEAVAALSGCAHIVHAGDIGAVSVIDALREIAPVTAIRGNVDTGPWAEQFPSTASLRLAGKRIYVLHDLKTLDFDPAQAGYGVVVSGHSHQPKAETRDGVLFVNPGSAGPRRFKLPVTLAHLRLRPADAQARHLQLLR